MKTVTLNISLSLLLPPELIEVPLFLSPNYLLGHLTSPFASITMFPTLESVPYVGEHNAILTGLLLTSSLASYNLFSILAERLLV